MGRLIPGDECARVYSWLGLSRAFFGRGGSMAGCGAGAGFSNERLDPRMIPGCQLFGCTDTTAFPQAVVWPVITTGDDDMEQAGTAAYTATNATKAKIGGAHSGAQCLEVTNTAANGNIMTATTSTYVVGNRMRNTGWAKSGDGVAIPWVVENGVTVLWEGTASTDWQQYDTGWYTVTGPLRFYSIGGVGGITCWDDMTWSTRNASQLTDLTGLGHHLVQATAAKQQLAVVSGSGYVVRGDGLARYFAANYAGNQPRTRYLLAKTTVQASARVMLDGLAADSGALKHKAASTTTQANAGSAFDGPAITDATWTIYRLTLNGAASSIAINGGAPTVGDAGAGNPAGLTLGAAGGGAAGWSVQDSAMVADYTDAHDLATAARIERYMRRLAARLSVPVP